MECHLTNCVIFYRTCSTPGSQPLLTTAVQPGRIAMMTAARAIATTTGEETAIVIVIGIVIEIVTTTAGTRIIAEMPIATVTGMATAISTTATATTAFTVTTAATAMVAMAGETTAAATRDVFQRRIRAVSIATTRAGSSIAGPITRARR